MHHHHHDPSEDVQFLTFIVGETMMKTWLSSYLPQLWLVPLMWAPLKASCVSLSHFYWIHDRIIGQSSQMLLVTQVGYRKQFFLHEHPFVFTLYTLNCMCVSDSRGRISVTWHILCCILLRNLSSTSSQQNEVPVDQQCGSLWLPLHSRAPWESNANSGWDVHILSDCTTQFTALEQIIFFKSPIKSSVKIYATAMKRALSCFYFLNLSYNTHMPVCTLLQLNTGHQKMSYLMPFQRKRWGTKSINL